jgi:MSHA biogenesis protein MshM
MDHSLLQEFYGFVGQPFGPAPDLTRIFHAASQAELVDSIYAELEGGCDVVAVRGDRGVGKTTLMTLLAAHLRAQEVACVAVTRLSAAPVDVQRQIARAGGLAGTPADPGDLLHRLGSEKAIDRMVLILDDAHEISAELFRYLWHLARLRLPKAATLHLVLIGDFGPWPGLHYPELERLRQATSSCYIMFALRDDEAEAYIEHRLRLAGVPRRRIMTRLAAAELVQRAGRNPAQLNALAQRVLMHGYRIGSRRITPEIVRQLFPADPAAFVPPPPSPGLRALATAGLVAALLAGCVGLTAVLLWPAPADRRAAQAVVRIAASAVPRPARLAAAGLTVPAPVVLPPVAPPASPDSPAKTMGGPGLVLVAGPGDSMPGLYAKVYRGLTPPPYGSVMAANPWPVKPGSLVVFPAPPEGWTPR